jgi:hypothetical protein
MLAVCCGCRSVKETTNISAVESDIQSHLSVGSSKADVLAYLEQRKITHEQVRKAEVLPNGTVVVHDTHTEGALIRGVRFDGMIETSIRIDFNFDDTDSKLVSHSVQEVYKGP